MKKFLIIGLIVSLVLIVVGGAGLVYVNVLAASNPISVTVTTSQNGEEIIQQFGPDLQQKGDGIVINPGRGTGDDGIFIGPGGGMGQYGFNVGPNEKQYGYGPGGMMGGDGGGGMMGGRGMMLNKGMGLMHSYLISAFANAVGLTVDEVNTRLANGETAREIALNQGKTEADLPALWTQVHQDALKAAVEEGVITQAQADAMLEQMNNSAGPGFSPGFGNCPLLDGGENNQP